MISRRSWPAVVAALGALTVGLSACGTSNPPQQPVASSSQAGGTQVDIPVDSQIMNLPLVTSSGKRTSLAAYQDKIIVISDSMTLCQETCPMDTANFVQTARAVDKAGLGGKVVFLSITVDPARDTPAQIAAYRDLFKPAPANWLTLTGTQANLNTLWKRFGVWWEKVPQDTPPPKNWRTGETLTYDIDHADQLFFIKGGHERYVFSGPGNVKPSALPAKLRSFLSDDGIKNLEHPQGDSWTVSQALQAMSDLTGKRISG